MAQQYSSVPDLVIDPTVMYRGAGNVKPARLIKGENGRANDVGMTFINGPTIK
jgi:hypothetical protein